MSALRSRLGALQHESGLCPDSDDPGKGAEAIGALRRRMQRVGAGEPRRKSKPEGISEQTLAARLGGHGAGDGVIRIHERLSPAAIHGDLPLFDPALYQALSHCGGEDGMPRACVFMDTETTGLAGGTGTLVFLLGMARFSAGALEICQILLTGFRGENALLREARDFLRDTDTLVTFNGRSFDSPLLAARYRLAGLADPFAPLRHVDLLHPTRRTFKNCWPDCRLQTAERRLLGVERIGDLPGSEAPRAWFDWVRHGRYEGLSAVCSHNRLDLLSLAVLPGALQRSTPIPLPAVLMSWLARNTIAAVAVMEPGRGPGSSRCTSTCSATAHASTGMANWNSHAWRGAGANGCWPWTFGSNWRPRVCLWRSSIWPSTTNTSNGITSAPWKPRPDCWLVRPMIGDTGGVKRDCRRDWPQQGFEATRFAIIYIGAGLRRITLRV